MGWTGTRKQKSQQRLRNYAIGAKYRKNHGKLWTPEGDLRITDPRRPPDRELAFELGKTVLAIHTRRNRLASLETVSSIKAKKKWVDHYGHVNYLKVPLIFEIAQDELLRSRASLSFPKIETDFGLRAFVAETTTTSYIQIFAGNQIEVRSRVVMGNTSLTFVQHATINEKPVARFIQKIVFVDATSNPAPLPDETKEQINRTIRNDS